MSNRASILKAIANNAIRLYLLYHRRLVPKNNRLNEYYGTALDGYLPVAPL